MSIKFHSSVIVCNDINAMRRFYEDLLNLDVEVDFGACIVFKGAFSLWQLSEKHTISQKLGYTFNPNGNKNLELCFETEDLDSVLGKLKKYNLNYLHNKMEETWGQKTVRFYDPEENLIEIGETIPTFIKRLYAEGLNVEQLHEKTSVPVDNIIEYLKIEK
jgi:catechol 2,3-dioxygenase-like lactoylglutathione lyase family enzyme